MRFRVLVVDDQQPFRMVAKTVIESTDLFEVCCEAATGEQAVEMVARLAPDMVLMDVNLPGMNGVDATRLIKAAAPGTVVVLVSTYDAGEYAPRATECGAAAYVPKSEFGPETLTSVWTAASSSA